MFAGVGCFSVLMTKCGKARLVYSIDLNPSAVKFMQFNARLNRVERNVIPISGDAKQVILNQLQHVADRVLMPLPDKAYAYLPYAVMALKPRGGWIHYYDLEHASKGEDPVSKVTTKVAERLETLEIGLKSISGRVVRSTGPRWHQVVLDIQVGIK
jgi:tRNA (guanine37-N1)-methyltransferase